MAGGEVRATQLCPHRATARGDNRLDLWSLRCADHLSAGGDGPGLFRGDGCQGGAQVGLVVQGDGGEQDQERREGVGSVALSAHAGLDDGEVHAALGKVGHCQRGQPFKEGSRPDIIPGEAS